MKVYSSSSSDFRTIWIGLDFFGALLLALLDVLIVLTFELGTLELFINSDLFVLGVLEEDNNWEVFPRTVSFGSVSITGLSKLDSFFKLSLETDFESSKEQDFVSKPSDKLDIWDKLLEVSDSFSDLDDLEEMVDWEDKDEPF